MNEMGLALDGYLDAGQPPVCPRCGAWNGAPLPSCADDGWTHDTACRWIRYADDVCKPCSDALDADLRASGVGSAPGAGQDDERVSVARDGDGDE